MCESMNNIVHIYEPNDKDFMSAYDQLSDAERLFVDQYCTKLDVPGALAFKAEQNVEMPVPLSSDSFTRHMLKRPIIRAAIADRMREISEALRISTERVLKEVALIGFSNMGNYVRIDSEGVPEINLSNVTVEQMAAVESFEVTETTNEKTGSTTRRTKIKLHSKMAALDMLMKYLNLYAPETHIIAQTLNQNTVNVHTTSEQAAEMYAATLRAR